MDEENISQKSRLKNIDETRNYLIKEINRNELMSKKHNSIKSTTHLYNSKLSGTLSYFSFYNYWMYFHFYFCFFSWYFYRN